MADGDAIRTGSGRLSRALAELAGCAPARLVELVAEANDVALLIDSKGVIRDLATHDPALAAEGWLGRAWLDTVNTDSVAKITAMRQAAATNEPARWRQVNHSSKDGDIPVRYRVTPVPGGAIAIGRDLRAEAKAQQQLLQAQQSLEREYLRLRNAEARYRLFFDMSAEPTLIVDAITRRIREANPAAHRLVGVKLGALANQPAGSLVAPGAREALAAYLGGAGARAGEARRFGLTDGGEIAVTASMFRQDRESLLLVRLGEGEAAGPAAGTPALEQVIARMPDAFVLVDAALDIVEANASFADLAGEPSPDRLRGTPLGERIGRRGVDLELVAAQLREHGQVRNVGTFVRGVQGAREEVELSGVAVESEEGALYGVVLRPVARRLRDQPGTERGAARSVEQLTELVGRVALKDIVRESTDVIERMCIEAALAYTSDNRASAAEILGLSRQSLYSKLNRHGLAARGETVQSD